MRVDEGGHVPWLEEPEVVAGHSTIFLERAGGQPRSPGRSV